MVTISRPTLPEPKTLQCERARLGRGAERCSGRSLDNQLTVNSGRITWFDHDVITEGVNLVSQTPGMSLGATPREPVRTKVGVEHTDGHDLEDGDQHGVLDSLAGFGVADAASQTGELRAQVGVLGSSGGISGLGRLGCQPLGAAVGPIGPAFATGLMVARTHAGPAAGQAA